MRERATAGAALAAAAGLVITSLVGVVAPAQAAALSIKASPSAVRDGMTISVSGNAGKAGAPNLFVAVCESTPTAKNCDQSFAGAEGPKAHILQVTPNAKTGAWGPVTFFVRQKLVTGNTPGGFDCLAKQTCVIGTTNAANPTDRSFNVTTPLTFESVSARPYVKVKATGKPKIKGTAKVGKKLTATKGSWAVPVTVAKYQWLRDGKAIAKATKAKYKLKAKDRGKRIKVRVTVTSPGYAATNATSKATAKVKKA